MFWKEQGKNNICVKKLTNSAKKSVMWLYVTPNVHLRHSLRAVVSLEYGISMTKFRLVRFSWIHVLTWN